MKAEHRKELQTNALADRLGRVVTNLKQGPQRGTGLYVVLGILVAALVFFSVRWYRVTKDENAQAWTFLTMYETQRVFEEYPASKPAQVAKMKQAWILLWIHGIDKIGADRKGAFENIEKAKIIYEDVKKEVAGDPVLEPETLYALAQIEEVDAVNNITALDTALEHYQDLAKAHPKSAYGQLAVKRVEALNDSDRRREIAKVYTDMQTTLFPFGRKN